MAVAIQETEPEEFMAEGRSTAARTPEARANPFGRSLRRWRRRRRRSQEALALDAGISQRHLSYLESGRAGPSREMVLHLAHVLDVPLRERNLLLQAAGFAAAYAHRPLDADELAGVSAALDLMLEGLEPSPALVVDRGWNLVRLNDAASRVFSLFVDPAEVWERIAPPGTPPNVLRLLFHPHGLRPWVVDFPQLAPRLLARVRGEADADPAWADGDGLLAELEGLAGVTAGPGPWQPTEEPVLTMTVERDGERLKLFTMIATFGTAQDVTVQELRVEAFFSADGDTRRRLEALADDAARG